MLTPVLPERCWASSVIATEWECPGQIRQRSSAMMMGNRSKQINWAPRTLAWPVNIFTFQGSS